MNKVAIALTAGLSCLSGLASGNDSYSYTCRHSNDTRIIDVLYLQRESPVPCEVRYTKHGSEESVETPWNASYTVGFCEQKAGELVEKQKDWGWKCEKDTPVKAVQPVQLPEMVKEKKGS